MGTETTWQDLLQPGDATDFFKRRPQIPFDANTTDFSAGNALCLAELSRLVYRHDIEEDNPPPQPTRKQFLEDAGFRERRFFSVDAKPDGASTVFDFFRSDAKISRARAMLVESVGEPKFAVLAFRGTEQNIVDFRTDLNVGPINPLDSGGPAQHLGFRTAFDLIWQDIETELQGIAIPVYYTGHSLGAALATLAAAVRPPRALYTFGSPRVGNDRFAASLAGLPAYRIVDDQDVVTTVPPEEFGYAHVGKVHMLTGPPLSPGEHLRFALRPPKRLADHAPVNYVDRMP